MYKEWTFLRPTFDSKRWQKLIFVAVITFRHKKIGTQTIKGNKIYWISHKSCRTCCHKYIKTTRYCSHSYNINNYQTWVVLLILHLKLNLEQSKHYTPQCPSGPQLNFLIFCHCDCILSDYSADLLPQKSIFCTRPWKVLTLQIREALLKWMRRIPPTGRMRMQKPAYTIHQITYNK